MQEMTYYGFDGCTATKMLSRFLALIQCGDLLWTIGNYNLYVSNLLQASVAHIATDRQSLVMELHYFRTCGKVDPS